MSAGTGRSLRAPRPRAEPADSRVRIQRAALARFARYGYEAVSLQQIADDVGLHKSSLFHHYANKPQLLVDVFDTVMKRMFEIVQPLREPGPPSREVLMSVLLSLVEHFCDEPQAARLVLAVITAPEDSPLRTYCDGTQTEFYAIGVAYLRRARQSGVIGRVNIQQAIPNLIGLVLLYPAVAHDLKPLVGDDPFSARARQVRSQELTKMLNALLA